MRRWPRQSAYSLAGAILALGAPGGLLLVRALHAARLSLPWVRDELASDTLTYVYIALSTLLAFVVYGTALGRQADRLYELSRTDTLTRLGNRRWFQERLDAEFARAARYGVPLGVLLVDLDGLKELNDRHGHRVGDQALSRVATAIRNGCRAADLAARWGGDEFALLAPSTGREEARLLAERIRALAGAGSGPDAVTVSVGLASLEPGSRIASPEALVRAADAALYEAKRTGRNRVVAG